MGSSPISVASFTPSAIELIGPAGTPNAVSFSVQKAAFSVMNFRFKKSFNAVRFATRAELLSNLASVAISRLSTLARSTNWRSLPTAIIKYWSFAL